MGGMARGERFGAGFAGAGRSSRVAGCERVIGPRSPVLKVAGGTRAVAGICVCRPREAGGIIRHEGARPIPRAPRLFSDKERPVTPDPIRIRRAVFVFVLLSLAAVPVPALAGWSPDPVEVIATSNTCPLVTACADVSRGAIVVWQENTSGAAGPLRARHLLATGDIDPAWPTLVTVTSAAASRVALGSVTDGQGGAYVWWQLGGSVYLTRVTAGGAIAAGWPAAGRVLGMQQMGSQRPSVLADGSGGVYVAFNQLVSGPPWEVRLMLAHLGPSNTGAGGFPAGGLRAIGTTSEQTEWVGSSSIGLAPDGGVWAAWGTSVVTETDVLAGDYRLTRLTPAGLPAAGWDARGVVLGTYAGDALNTTSGWSVAPGMSLVAVASDGADGAYLLRGDADTSYPGTLTVVPRLFRLGAGGAVAAGWPAAGWTPYAGGLQASFDNGATASLRLLPDGSGGVFVGQPAYASEMTNGYDFARIGANAATLPGGVGAMQNGLEFALRGDGGMFVTSFNANGPSSAWSPAAYVSIGQSAPGTGWSEWHDTPMVTWYADDAVASLGDGSAVFAWSQVNERHGIYAVRVNGAGLVTGVEPAPAVAAPRLALHFARGEGVTLFATFGAPGTARCVLADVAGRAVARGTFEAGVVASRWTLPGTAGLPAGLYLARVECGGRALTGKVAIVR
jgi:hypothetical protein